jgi:hypothetical protein
MFSSDAKAGLWSRLATTFGPTVAGLLGGGLAGLLALATIAPLGHNVAATYAHFPSLQRPWLAADMEWPAWMLAVAVFIGLAAPVAMGALAVWLARPRDIWGDLSIGVSTALAGTLAAFVSCVGWPVMMAFIVVPSIADTTLVGDAFREAPAAVHPSDPLAERYTDLKAVDPERRGQVFMAKITSDQVAASARAVWYGILTSFLTAGTLALCGTLAAGYLCRRGEGFYRAAVPYLELTLPPAGTLGTGILLVAGWSPSAADENFALGLFSLLAMAIVSVLMVSGVIRRWAWLPRLCLALTWVMLLVQSRHEAVPWFLPAAALVLTGFLFQQLFARRAELALNS